MGPDKIMTCCQAGREVVSMVLRLTTLSNAITISSRVFCVSPKARISSAAGVAAAAATAAQSLLRPEERISSVHCRIVTPQAMKSGKIFPLHAGRKFVSGNRMSRCDVRSGFD